MRVPTLTEIEAEQLSRSLRTFVEQAWPLLEPTTPYTSGYHLDAIIEALEAVTRGELSRVIVNVPPRHGKSSLVSVLWLPWVWTFRPEWRWIVGSYSQDFASRDSVRSRRVIESPWYRERWGDRYRLSGDQSTKLRFENDRTGLRLATSLGGRATGEGADVIILDDPHKASDAYSATPRENVVQWFRGTIATRLNDPRKGAIVLVCQRLHEADLCGTLLKDEGWIHICLPAEYEPDHPFVYPDDPRGYAGEPLWPGRIGTDELAAMKRQMSPLDVAGQLQQRPSPGGGGVFRTRAWRFFDPEQQQKPFDDILISWDLAFGATLRADYAVGQVWASRGDDRYLLRSIRDRFSFQDLLTTVRLLSDWVAKTYPKHANSPVLVEKAANGQALVDTLRKEIENLYLVPPLGSKVQRALAVVPLIEAGHVYLPGVPLPDGGADPLKTPQWVKEFLLETESFPRGNFDDQVDALTQALAGFRPGPRIRVLDGS